MRRWVWGLVAASVVLAGCGGDDDDDGGSPSASASASASGSEAEAEDTGGPVTIEHLYGSTTIEAAPERIVSLDDQWTDVLLALDAPVVGAAMPIGSDVRYPWQQVPDDVEPIVGTDSIPFEAVAALQPDLIVGTWQITDEATYETLTGIAPTIALLGDRQVDAWQDIAAAAGKVLGKADDAAALVTDAEEQAAAVLADLPGIEGRTYAMANYVPGDAIYVVADPDDGSARFFRQLGLSIDPDMLALAGDAGGRVQLSLERVGELDADLLVLFTNGADASEVPGFDGLPAVQSGAVAVLDRAAVSGLNTPSPLSIPYSLEQIRSALEALAASGG